MIWFTSDTHYSHRNICRGTSAWIEEREEDNQRCRDFDTLEQMNDAIVNNINKVVKHDDVLYHLGDWSFGGVDEIWKFRHRLNVQTIHLIYGNHDHHIRKNKISNGFGEAQDLFTSVQEAKQITVEGQMINLFHYACRVWDKSHRGSWMLYGHSHGSLVEYNFNPGPTRELKLAKTTDVGMDAHPEFRPFSFEELKDKFKYRKDLITDHHTQKTN